MIRSALMNVMTAAVLKAGRGLKRDFGEVENLQVSVKGPGDFVTAADRRAEKTLFEELSRARPGYGFLMEESGAVEGSDKSHIWHIDPLDGTSNFLHGIPIFAVSVGLEREGQLVAGVVYNPASDEMFVAEKGQGAYFNNRRMRVSARKTLGESLVACGIPPLAGIERHARFQTELAAVMAKTGNIRRLGAAALDLAFVAAGRCDGYWERGIKPWDIAAGIVLVREAGGFVTDLDNGSDMLSKSAICAGNEAIHRHLLDTLRKA
ncbi:MULTISPECIES: inositol monophosphatase family protein [Methylosinus]|uniref:Inositol-1-monophosphatase n=1 Tax=Methylosinus trichosporium (strain ATCC 35070 / NCIMB 11131 / UNIQEM 75 / OB3b) TaxID=595536 RepID=A0A2D2CVH8_METT3|nr:MULTISPECIES: inositol monophosphatase family protein [Methylosinus]ATQ66656.1 inositol monophosphatase [Methylosinus trichosporium OB3b]OBS51737.1 inositol monophosphatase [Methylosinus sp. 3S-1]